MSKISKEIMVEIINKNLPWSNQIKNWDLQKKSGIYFEWRGNRYKVECDVDTVYVNKSEGACLRGDDMCSLIEIILRNALLAHIVCCGWEQNGGWHE